MKTKFLLLLLLTILLQVNTSSFAREMKSARQIELRTKTPAQHRSIPPKIRKQSQWQSQLQ